MSNITAVHILVPVRCVYTIFFFFQGRTYITVILLHIFLCHLHSVYWFSSCSDSSCFQHFKKLFSDHHCILLQILSQIKNESKSVQFLKYLKIIIIIDSMLVMHWYWIGNQYWPLFLVSVLAISEIVIMSIFLIITSLLACMVIINYFIKAIGNQKVDILDWLMVYLKWVYRNISKISYLYDIYLVSLTFLSKFSTITYYEDYNN